MPLDGDEEVFFDNRSGVKNSSIPTSVLKKTHHFICYHRVREDQDAGAIRVGWVPGEFNLAVLFTKTNITRNERKILVNLIFSNEEYPIGRV